MESNVVSLGTAKRLQAAGFAKSLASCRWVENKANGEWSVRVDGGIKNVGFGAPTAEELAHQLPVGYIVAIDEGHKYVVTHVTDLLDEDTQTGETMAEAFAALWLKLSENANI